MRYECRSPGCPHATERDPNEIYQGMRFEDWFESVDGLCKDHRLIALQDREQREIAEARARRNEAMAVVEDHAESEWKEEAWEALVAYVHSHEEFFVDDFWRITELRSTREDRALGPIVQRASRQHLIERTGESRASVRSNLTHKPVWRSLVYQGSGS